MSGEYEAAIDRYNTALQERTGWQVALTNRKIAQERQKRLEFEGADMTGGMLAADKGIRFDQGPPKDQDQRPDVAVAGLEDVNIQDIWLRRVQTKPGDFLKAKFAYQLANPITALPATSLDGDAD